MPIYQLALRGALHVGAAVSIERQATLDWLPSDTLFAALVTAWAQMGADVNARLSAFNADAPPLQITSAFPWIAGIRFLPAPAVLPKSIGLEGKDAKRVQWMSSAVYAQLRAGAIDARNKQFLHDGSVWVTANEHAQLAEKYTQDDGEIRLWQMFVVPRVTVDRATNASNLFHAGRVSFAPGDGLWFAARGTHSTWVDEALPFLADAGVGGLRNYGHGAFKHTASADDLPATPTTGAGLLLSRYAPRDADEIAKVLKRDGTAYRLVTVGGWCTDDDGHPWRRAMVRLIAEGAVIADVADARGKLVDVRPAKVAQFEHRAVYRFGLPFFVPAEVNE
jgi:CRISPR-associated protein Csm4